MPRNIAWQNKSNALTHCTPSIHLSPGLPLFLSVVTNEVADAAAAVVGKGAIINWWGSVVESGDIDESSF